MKTLIIAHRGGRYWEGDDFSYITKAIEEGADIIELDIKLKNNEYIVQHSIFDYQGQLSNALKKVKNTPIYLDIKDKRIDPNDLIRYVRSYCSNKIIIGTTSKKVLGSIKDKSVIRNYHCFAPFLFSLRTANEVNTDWINPFPYFIRKKLIKEIIDKGFKFVPGGNNFDQKKETFKKQIKYIKKGAHAISVYDVKKFKEKLKN